MPNIKYQGTSVDGTEHKEEFLDEDAAIEFARGNAVVYPKYTVTKFDEEHPDGEVVDSDEFLSLEMTYSEKLVKPDEDSDDAEVHK